MRSTSDCSRPLGSATAMAVVAAVLFCAVSARCDDPPSATGISLRINSVVKVTPSIPVPDPFHRVVPGADTLGEVQPDVGYMQIDVVSNTISWGLVVELRSEAMGKRGQRVAVAACRLLDEDGVVLHETLIEQEPVLIPGNGVRGSQTLFLEVSGLGTRPDGGAAVDPVVDVRGWAGE